jgi:hypothetical protein
MAAHVPPYYECEALASSSQQPRSVQERDQRHSPGQRVSSRFESARSSQAVAFDIGYGCERESAVWRSPSMFKRQSCRPEA